MSFFRSLRSSFANAWRGLALAFRTERSFRLQAAAAVIVLAAAFILPIQPWQRALVLLATASVLVLELMNSMIERLVDLVKPRLHEYARDIKDLMAAAVLTAALFALVLGLLVFGPYVLPFLNRV